MSRQTVLVFAIICAAALLAGSVSASTSTKAPKSSTYCTICGFLVNIVEGWISSNTTEQELMTLLDKGCSYLGSFTEECTDFVNSEIPAIIQLILEKEPASAVCASFCSNSTKNVERQKLSNCPLCDVAVKVMSQIPSKDPQFAQKVSDKYLSACMMQLGGANSYQCTRFKTEKLRRMIQHVQSGSPASSYCLVSTNCI